MAYDYIFTVGADASAIAKEVTKEMANVQSMMADNELLIKFTGDQKSLQDVLKKIQNADPSATIRFEGDQKSFQQLLSGLQGDIKKNLKLDDDQLGLKSAFDGIKKIASKTLQNVNLTPFFSRITDGFLDSTKSAQDLYDIISHTKDEIELLASLTNRTSLQYMTDKQIDDVIKKLREQVSLQQDYAKAVDEAKKHQDKFYLSRDKINEEIQKKNSRGEFTKGKGLELAKQLGITKGLDTTKSDNGELLIHDYSRTAALLDELIAKKKEFSETNPEGFLQQSKQIFDVFTRLSSLQDQMIKQFKIAKDAQELLLGNYDRNEIISDLNQAQMAYAERATKKQKQNVDAAKRELNEWLSKTAGKQQKKVERDVENTQKRAEEDNEKIPSRRKNNSIVQTGSDARDAAESLEEMGEAGQSSGQSVANGVGNATEAIEKLKGEIREAEEELDRLNSKKGERTSTINAPTFRKDYLKYEIEQLGKLSDPEEIDKKQKRIMDLYATYKKHFAGSPINSDELVKALKQIETAQADYLPNANAALDNLISDDMIDAQIQKIDKLKQELSKLQSFSQTNGVSGETVSSPTIDIDPNQALEAINKINDALKELPDSKEINISVNGPVAKSLDLLKGMKEIDSLYGKQESEEGIAFNDITGIASYVNQELGRGVHTGKLVDYLGGKANSVLHTHPNVNYAAFSGDEFKNMLETEYKKGITKQFVKAGREIAMLDIEKLVSSGVKASDLQEKFSQNWNKESTEKLQQKAQNVKLQDLLPQNYADIIRGKIQETITNSFSGSIVDNSLSQDLLKDIMNTITSNIQKRISSNETYGGEVVTEELDDAVKQLIQKRIKGLNISSLDAEKIGDDVLYDVDDLIGKEFKRFKSLTENENMQVKQSALKNAIKSYGLDPSEIFKVMDQDEWLSSIYPQQLEKPIEVKIDTSKAEDQLEDLTKERTIKINIEDASLQSKSVLSDFTEIEKQSEAYADAAKNAEKLADAKKEASGESPSSTAISDSFQQESKAVGEAMSAEQDAIDELKAKLVGEIPEAVDVKTQAFRGEQAEVSDLIDLEIGKVEELAKVLQNLFKGGDDTNVLSGLKDLFESINNVKVNKDTVQNLTDASWAIDTIGESFKKLSNEGINSSAFDSLNELLKKSEELKSLAKILEASEKKIATAGKAAGAGTTGKTTANPTKDATAEYKELLATIEAATKAKTELNKIETKQVNGKPVDAQLAEASVKSASAAKAANDAIFKINDMYKQGAISVEQYVDAMDKLAVSSKGTAESIDALATAQKNAALRTLKSDTQTQIEIYRKESEEYKKLYRMQNSGGISTQDEVRMADLARYMTDQQTEWNAKIAQGAEFIEKMTGGLKTVAQLQADVSQEFSDKWTKSLNNQLETMEKQSSWRKGNWKDIIDELRQEATVFKENIGTRDYKENQKAFDALIGRMKATMKSEDFLPIRETWKSSFTAKIETWANQNKIAAKEFGEQLETLKGQIAAVDNEAEASRLENIFSGIQSDAASKNLLGKSLGDRFKDQFKNTMTSLATYYLSFQDFIRYGREAISVVTELDTQLTEMRKVSNESLQTLQQYQLESFDIADRVGTTAAQIQSSTADWLRLGKDLPTAASMAEMSTKLLNVSEFTDIKDATDALVSATQAYTEVTASDIVDKLNLIGNNFAVSTDELAQGLQNAGAVLKTQGNDLDQTLALLTAGNLIGQDMSKASAGIRTIALRISGTEEAKNEIADMGEDVDDFVVRTRSKTDQIIKDYTAVASNMYQGVSVLDPNGNLRDTYDILLDISKIYSEIQAEDKQRGTNRAQALVEQLAGIILPDKYRNIFLRTHLNALIT